LQQQAITNTNLHPALPSISPKIREKIIKGDFIDFSTLLPKAMFSLATESSGYTFQLLDNGGELSLRPSAKPKRITSFSNWNVYLAVCINHTPSRGPSLVAYQRIIASASSQQPLESWMNYDIRFRTLAAYDPSLRWDVCHGNLWLECFASPATPQVKRWPCRYYGATNH